MPRAKRNRVSSVHEDAQTYQHPTADLPARPEIGTQAHFKKAKPPTTYHYDSSLAPELNWDGQNPAREQAESLVRTLADCGLQLAELAPQPASPERGRQIDALREQIRAAESTLRKISGPFLNWCGKAERLSFDVPTLPLFVHERLSTKAILETLKGHKRDKQMDFLDVLFGSPERSLHDQVLRAYEHRDKWVNRLILGDSLVAMNSLLRFESLGGQVQMIYVDPPYGVKFGSNFQPFIRKRDVKHNDDGDFTREPEMVQAYRDTWELGLHSYLSYLRDRLLLARELLHPSGSIFVQISDENLHHVREVMDEVFGAENFAGIIGFFKTSSQSTDAIPSIVDFVLCYARDRQRQRLRTLHRMKAAGERGAKQYTLLVSPDMSDIVRMTDEQLRGASPIPEGWKVCALGPLTSQGFQEGRSGNYEFEGRFYTPPPNRHWSYDPAIGGEMDRLATMGRIKVSGSSIRSVLLADDNPLTTYDNVWMDTGSGSFTEEWLYVVQTNAKVIERCLLMSTDPGDLVLDPTCGSGTTAFVAERWGRRWITCDTSRVPLALARQRLLTATFDYYALKDEKRGPAGGFLYERRQNKKGEELGGIVPHMTLKSIANNEPPAEEVLVDRPEAVKGVVRVTGPFAFEATIPAAEGLDDEPETPGIQSGDYQAYVERMIEILRRAPVLRLPGNQTVTLRQIRPPAKTLALSAEAVVDGVKSEIRDLKSKSSKSEIKNLKSAIDDSKSADEPVAILFGPEHGPLGERLVREAWDEAGLKHYQRLLVIGFGIDPKAREFVDKAGQIGIPCVYLQATMDLQMGDLLKNMRSSQVFSVCGLPDVKVTPLKPAKSKIQNPKSKTPQWQAELLGLDTFDPATMEPDHLAGGEVPAWFLDTNYNGLVFRVCQAFFPRTGAWENLKKSLKVEFEDTVWEHLAGTISAPFEAGEHGQIAVKVIDPRGNELLVVKKLEGER